MTTKKKPILNELFESRNNHIELAPEIDKNEFIKTVTSRRSVRVYNKQKVNEEDMRSCIELALLAPNSSNLQPWEFYWVRTIAKKNKLVEYCLGQPAAATAQELVVAVARPDYWKVNQKKMLKKINEMGEKAPRSAIKYYDKIVPLAYRQGFLSIRGYLKKIAMELRGIKKPTPREPYSKRGMAVWAHKSTALACENLMLALRAYGYDSCPMEGIDSTRIKKLLELKKPAEISMVISAGKRAENGVYGKQVRFNSKYFIHEL
ncbi:MAG: nitroreductase family protein [Crocinitomicaceae bacterium]|nr:nitroreductase family protein [Crocinitomicaceae bacterium]|tara:strand:- start:3383 stop:4168 length:786 start_codon:yes stop_codon:yes gene_type:complete